MPLEIYLAEYRESIKEGVTKLPELAQHVWYEQHKFLWDQLDIVVPRHPVVICLPPRQARCTGFTGCGLLRAVGFQLERSN